MALEAAWLVDTVGADICRQGPSTPFMEEEGAQGTNQTRPPSGQTSDRDVLYIKRNDWVFICHQLPWPFYSCSTSYGFGLGF
jgi:hypothetical protein